MQTIITADCCINHNGQFSQLIDLLNMIVKVNEFTGETVLFKLQKRNPEVYSDKPYQSWLLNREVPYKVHKASLEFTLQQYKDFDSIAKQKNVEWYVSVFDSDSFELMADNFDFKYWKIASPVTAELPELAVDITRQPGLKFVSTGMCSVEELDYVVNRILMASPQDDIMLMHCVSMYPTPANKVNLKSIDWLKNRYGLKVGLSSHDTGVALSVCAVAMGAEAIEKHITLDRGLPGPDHGLSLELKGLETLVRHISDLELALGEEKKVFYEEERFVRDKVRVTNRR
ncbi:hypothetical protein LCGC14_0545670 [marine sediment metagenome]|uniref:PseI/NeuA/B-like domain-containing protein n=1 Tax=marine sediment metagenome TaxID=412755 RepID=A0A0F9S9W9_9ZZZZ